MSLPSDINCTAIPATLRNLTVAFVGDSLMSELQSLAECLLPIAGTTAWGLHMVPGHASLARMLRSVLDTADVVVFNFGIWYNFNASLRPLISSWVDENYVSELIQQCVNRGLKLPKTTTSNMQHGRVHVRSKS